MTFSGARLLTCVRRIRRFLRNEFESVSSQSHLSAGTPYGMVCALHANLVPTAEELARFAEEDAAETSAAEKRKAQKGSDRIVLQAGKQAPKKGRRKAANAESEGVKNRGDVVRWALKDASRIIYLSTWSRTRKLQQADVAKRLRRPFCMTLIIAEDHEFNSRRRPVYLLRLTTGAQAADAARGLSVWWSGADYVSSQKPVGAYEFESHP